MTIRAILRRSLFTSSLTVRNGPIHSIELAQVLLTPFAEAAFENRRLVWFVLESIHTYFEHDGAVMPVASNEQLQVLADSCDSLMLLASRLEISLDNQVWSGDKMADLSKMYTRIVLGLANFLLSTTTAGDPRVHLRETLHMARSYLTSGHEAARTVERDVANVARKYHIQCPLASSQNECPRPKGLRRRLGAKLKSIFKGKSKKTSGPVTEITQVNTSSEAEDNCIESDSQCQSTASSVTACDWIIDATPKDPYYGLEQTATMYAAAVTTLFPGCGAPTPSSESALVPDLVQFIAEALHFSQVPSSVQPHAFNILQRLKTCNPDPTGRSHHGLYLAALMTAAKFLWDGHYSNKYWTAIIGQGLFNLSEVNAMEARLCVDLEWDLGATADELGQLEANLWNTYQAALAEVNDDNSDEDWGSLASSSSWSSSSSSEGSLCQI